MQHKAFLPFKRLPPTIPQTTEAINYGAGQHNAQAEGSWETLQLGGETTDTPKPPHNFGPSFQGPPPVLGELFIVFFNSIFSQRRAENRSVRQLGGR